MRVYSDFKNPTVQLQLITLAGRIRPSKERPIVKGRALCCYWAVHELGMSMSNVADRLQIAGPTVSVAVKKGDKIVSDEGLVLSDVLNIRI